MAAIDEERFSDADRRERPSRPPRRSRDAPDIRVPRLLVAWSEISWRLLVCIAAFAVVVFALTKVAFAVVPVVLALLLATLLAPPARWLRRRGVPPALATVIVFLAAFLLVAGVVAAMAPAVANESHELGPQVRDGADEAGRLIAKLPIGVSEREVQDQINHLDDRITEHSSTIRSGLLTGAQAAGQVLAGLVVTLTVLFFFVKDGDSMWRWVCSRFPEARKPALEELGERSWRVLSAYVRGVVTVALIDAVGIGLGLFILGVPLVLPLAIFTFVMAFIPLVGSVVAGIAAALVALVANGAVTMLLVIGVVVLVQQLEGNVLYPMIMSRNVELHPVAVLLAVTVGGLLFGIVGAALAVPIATVGAAAATVVDRHAVHGEVSVGRPQGREERVP